MHARRTILEAIREELEDALADLGSPAQDIPLFEEDETADVAPCVQYSLSEEEPGEDETKGFLDRLLACRVTVRGITPEQRDELSEAIESAMLENTTLPGLEVNWKGTQLKRDADGGRRVFNAHYNFILHYQTVRSSGSLY